MTNIQERTTYNMLVEWVKKEIITSHFKKLQI